MGLLQPARECQRPLDDEECEQEVGRRSSEVACVDEAVGGQDAHVGAYAKSVAVKVPAMAKPGFIPSSSPPATAGAPIGSKTNGSCLTAGREDVGFYRQKNTQSPTRFTVSWTPSALAAAPNLRRTAAGVSPFPGVRRPVSPAATFLI